MSKNALFFVFIAISLVACGDATDSSSGNAATEVSAASTAASGQLAIEGLPDPCEWLSAEEAQELLGLDEPPPQTPMGGPETASRSCVYTNEAQTAWINVSYQGLNPQVFTAQGKSEAELSELASSMYADTLEHVYSGETDGYPTLAFEDAERTIMVVFTDIGKARNLPEGISDRLSISTYYNVLLHLFAPDQSGGARLEAVKRLVDRPVAQLKAAVGG